MSTVGTALHLALGVSILAGIYQFFLHLHSQWLCGQKNQHSLWNSPLYSDGSVISRQAGKQSKGKCILECTHRLSNRWVKIVKLFLANETRQSKTGWEIRSMPESNTQELAKQKWRISDTEALQSSPNCPSSVVCSHTGLLHSPVLFRSGRNPWTWTQ